MNRAINTVSNSCKWHVLLALALYLCLWDASLANAATYAYRNDTFSYDTPSASATALTWHTTSPSPACTGYPNGDDDWADVNFPSGFTFTFGGVNYTKVRVYSNGILAFGNDVSGFHRDYTPQALPTGAGSTYSGCPTAAPVNIMLGYWIDIVAGTANSTSGASLKYELLGTAPNRRLVFSWVNVKLYGSTTRYNFQIALYESTTGTNGNFKYQYTSGSSNGSNATVGVQLSSTDYTQYSYNQTFIDTTNGTAILWYPSNQLQTKAAEFRFDESIWNGVAGEIKDTSGNSLDASRVGNAASVAGGKLCRGGSFTSNTSNVTVDAVATPIVPGNTGTVDFWYKSTNSWTTADTMLLDATSVASRPFFLMKRSNGALRFVVTDSAGTSVTATSPTQSFSAGQWVHIGVAWNVRVGTNLTVLEIFINGVLQNSTRGTTTGTLPALSSLYVGDNRTSGVTPSNGTPNGANGSIDEVYIYPIQISAPQVAADMNLTRLTCSELDHFHIIHDGAVSNCATPASITIEAHDASHALFYLAGSAMNLSTTPAHGTWSDVSGGAINPLTAIGAGTGAASYTFANESRVTFGLSNTLSEDLNINVASGVITEHSRAAASCVAADYTTGTVCDASRTFLCAKPFGFNCVQSGADALSGHLYTKLAGTAFSFEVVALKDTNSDGTADAVETAYASDVDKSVSVELVDGSGLTACSSRVTLIPDISQTLTFTKANQTTELGRKGTTMTIAKAYPNLRCRVTDANQSPSIISCSTDNFAVRPGAVTLSTSASATPPSATATPTIRAGAAFTVTAATSTAATDTYTGILTLDTSKLTAQITNQDTSQQNGGTVGTLSPVSLTANQSPAPSGNATYTEVGHLYLAPGAYRDNTWTSVDQPDDCVSSTTLDANLADSLDVNNKYGCSIGNKTTVAFGRFIPDHFAITPGVVTEGCDAGNFTYFAQDGFSTAFTLTAQNAANATTQNYTGAFAKFVPTSWSSYNFTATWLPGAPNPISTLMASATAPTGNWNNGTVAVSAKHQASRPASPVAVANITVNANPIDTDGVTIASATPVQTAATPLRYGRLVLKNAYGTEREALKMRLQTQYYNGSSFITNADDTCVSYSAAALACTDANVSDTLACADVTVSGTNLGNGQSFTLSAPNKTGNLLYTLTVPAWLQYEWDGLNNDYNENPFARANFGIYRGNDRILNWREIVR